MTSRTRFARKTALFVILLLVVFHWLFISPVIRKYRTRIPNPNPWRKGLDLLTKVSADATNAVSTMLSGT